MSHPTVWRCRACKTPLGIVRRGGALEPQVPGVTISRDGVARLACLSCGQVREWRPTQVARYDR